MPTTFLLRTLGAAELVELDSHGHPMPRLLGSGKPLALLAFCCASRDREHSRDFLSGLLWSDAEPTRARQSLRQALWRLRRLVGESLRTRDDAVFGVDAAVETDRDRFLQAVYKHDGAAALIEYGGAFLAGLSAPGSDEFDEWAAFERRQLEDSLLRVVEPYLRDLLASGRPSVARDAVDRLLAVASDNVDAHRIAITVRLELGDRESARRAADALEVLANDLGDRASQSAMAIIARARDIEVNRDSNAPTPMTLDLVGRESAFSSVMAAWTRAKLGHAQFVLLTGSAGVGKSRLLQAIERRCASKRTLGATIRANPGERDVPFGFASAMARTLAALPGAAGISSDSARELVALDPALSAQFAAAAARDVDGETTRRRALALFDLVSAIAEQNPLSLCIDDLHWIDAASRQVLSIIFGRVNDLSLLVVVATRGSSAGIFDQRLVVTVPINPLAHDESVDAVRSVGSWPDTPPALRFVDVLASASEGVPLGIVERLNWVRDSGLLTEVRGQWMSADWERATHEVAVSSPWTQRLGACSDRERAVLMTLAVAGAPLATSTVSRAMRGAHDAPNVSAAATAGARFAALSDDAHDTTSARVALETLEVKGLVSRAGEAWIPSHDLVAERLLRDTELPERRPYHLALAMAFASFDDGDGAKRAARHYILAGDDTHAGVQFARVVARARRVGDRRSAADLLADLATEGLADSRTRIILRQVPLLSRVHALRERSLIAVLSVLTIVVLLSSWKSASRPLLVLRQTTSRSLESATTGLYTLDTIGLDSRVRRTEQPFAVDVSSSDKAARTSFVHVRSLTPGVRIVAGDSAPVISGLAVFNALLFLSSDGDARFRFDADGFRPVEASVISTAHDNMRPYPSSVLRLRGGVLNQRVIDPSSPALAVEQGGRIEGYVDLEYSSPIVAGSVWLSMTPTWGDPREEGREITPLITPVIRDRARVALSLIAPHAAGRYWILYVVAAEPSGMYALSRTNWTLNHPIWGDGNDLASLNDSTIREAVKVGLYEGRIAQPADWQVSPGACNAPVVAADGTHVKYCLNGAHLTGVEIVVR